jgi:hypothetical protein
MLDFFGELAKLKLQSRDYTAKPKKKDNILSEIHGCAASSYSSEMCSIT